MTLKKHLKSLGLVYSNDIVLKNKGSILEKIHNNATFSFSFIVLLVSSSIICTLGLLLNSAPVVIGGMIISPLMWPLIKTAVGISNENPIYVRHAISLLCLAILITFICSSTITFISPIKGVTTQILARTTPTLLDLVIAIVAGTIAALAITQPKISESLAGVAIATSLMPPLCVSGIGLALSDYSSFTGGFLLFFANAIAIIFVAILVFSFVGIRHKTKSHIQKKGLYLLIGVILITAVPLYNYLKTYSFKSTAYHEAQTVLQKDFQNISPSITVTDIVTEVSNSKDRNVSIQAQILIPQNISIDYSQQQQIIQDLEEKLHKKVDLTLHIQQTISILSEEDIQKAKTKQSIEQSFILEIHKINSAVSVDNLNTTYKNNMWTVNATLRANPSVTITQADRTAIETGIEDNIGTTVHVNLEITPLIQLLSKESVENDKIRHQVEKSLGQFLNTASLSAVVVGTLPEKQAEQTQIITIELRLPPKFKLPEKNLTELKTQLEAQYTRRFILEVKVLDENTTTY